MQVTIGERTIEVEVDEDEKVVSVAGLTSAERAILRRTVPKQHRRHAGILLDAIHDEKTEMLKFKYSDPSPVRLPYARVNLEEGKSLEKLMYFVVECIAVMHK